MCGLACFSVLGFPKHSVVRWPVAGKALALVTFPIVKERAFPHALNQGFATWTLVAKAGTSAGLPPVLRAEACAARPSL